MAARRLRVSSGALECTCAGFPIPVLWNSSWSSWKSCCMEREVSMPSPNRPRNRTCWIKELSTKSTEGSKGKTESYFLMRENGFRHSKYLLVFKWDFFFNSGHFFKGIEMPIMDTDLLCIILPWLFWQSIWFWKTVSLNHGIAIARRGAGVPFSRLKLKSGRNLKNTQSKEVESLWWWSERDIFAWCSRRTEHWPFLFEHSFPASEGI